MYGAGTISGMIVVGNPFVQPVSARKFWENWVDIYRDIAAYGTKVPFKLYPECPGLLPCGDYADFNIINWLTDPRGDQWRLTYYSRSHGFFDLGPISLIDFVLELLTGTHKLPNHVMSNILVSTPRQFEPGATFS